MEHVVQIANQIAVETKIIGRPFIDKFITTRTMSNIQIAFDDYFESKWIRTEPIEKVVVSVTSSPIDRKNNRVIVNMEITFNNILERLILISTIK
jgi:hypothetical protein